MSIFYIVAETGCDILKSDLEKYNNIRIVPMHVSIDGESRDDGTFPVSDVFDSYNRTKELPKTSATNPHEYKTVFDKILNENPDNHVLHVAYSAITTASYHNATLASDGDSRITHIDTKQVSGGQRAVVIALAEYISNNPDASVEDIIRKADDLIEKARFVFFPGNLEYLKAGGRVSNAAYLLASFLGLKPLIEMIDGKLVGTKKYRGSDNKIYKKLVNDYLSSHKINKDSFFMVQSHGLDENLAAELEKEANKFGYDKITWVPTGCVISTHSGPGAFGLGGFEI